MGGTLELIFDLPCYSKRSLDEALEKPKEPAQITGVVEFGKSARVLPVLEAEPLAKWIPAQHRDEGEEDQGDNQDDLPQCGPELALAVPLHGEQVDEPENITVRQGLRG